MTDATLAKWLRERLPQLQSTYMWADKSDHLSVGDFMQTVDTLTALLALLGEADVCMTLAGDSKRKIACRARLRAVLPRAALSPQEPSPSATTGGDLAQRVIVELEPT